MAYDSKQHHRRSIRWFAYDYAQAGAYFVTVCSEDHVCLFGSVIGATMQLNAVGYVAQECRRQIPGHFENVELDTFVVMPNHVHGIIVIHDAMIPHVGATHASPLRNAPNGPKPRSVGTIVGSYKSAVSKRINEVRATPGRTLWQRNYYEHVIRGEQQLSRIRRYIEDNPAHWTLDHENPQAKCYGQVGRLESFSY
jgi:putative transposase